MIISDIEIEFSILSALLYDNSIFFEHEFKHNFFTGSNAIIFDAIKNEIANGGEANLSTIFSSLKQKVSYDFLEKVNDWPLSTNIEHGILKLETASNLREIQKGLTAGLEKCVNRSELSEIESTVSRSFLNIGVKDIDFKKQIISAFEDMNAAPSRTKSNNILTGIKSLDWKIDGFERGELVIIAGRAGTGKTSLAMNIVRNFCHNNLPGMVSSLEMSTEQLTKRMACDVESIDGALIFLGQAKKLQGDQLSRYYQKLERAGNSIYSWPWIIDDRPNLTIDQIASKARKLKTTNKIEWLVIDHSRRIKGWNIPGQESKSEIVCQCKTIARELNIVVILLSQLNRKIEDRNEYIPKNSDLKDTGALEEEADIILFPSVLDQDGYTEKDQHKEACIYITKTRRGNIGKIDGIRWQGHYFRFSDNRY